MMTLHESEYRILYRDIDSMGYLYYSRYLELFELGRVDWMRKEGFTYKNMEKSFKKGLPVTQAICNYKKPLRYDDLAIIKTELIGWSGVTLSFRHEIFKKKSTKIRATGSVELGCINLETKQISRIPDPLLKLLKDKFLLKKGRIKRT